MNSFYASVEMAYNPSLKGKPLAIAGNPEERRGIIVTCSYEARRLGIKTTMPLWEAKKICPQLIVMRPNFERYRNVSAKMFSILRDYTDLVEPVSIDEGYMDVSNYKENHPLTLAKNIQSRLLHELDLPCSIGIAPNKFLAKMASDMKKPLGITVLRKRDIEHVLWPLPVQEMHGVGTKTAEKLHTIQVNTIGELASANEIQLKSLLGINGIRLKERANGQDDRPVDPDSIYDYKSIGNSTTLQHDTTDQTALLTILQNLSKTVSYRLKNKQVYTTSLMITIRYSNWNTWTRSEKLGNPIQDEKAIFAHAKRIFLKHWNGTPIRLLGITGNQLVEQGSAYKQLDLFTFEEDAKEEPLINTIEQLQEKYGKGSITKGVKNFYKEGQTNTSFNKDFLLNED